MLKILYREGYVMRNGYSIAISEYQPAWGQAFKAERLELEAVFGQAALEIEHVGSTSVEGLSGKPILDIAVMIERYKDADEFTEPLSRIGYEVVPHRQPGLPERHFYTKGNPIKYHLSVAYTDCGGYWPR